MESLEYILQYASLEINNLLVLFNLYTFYFTFQKDFRYLKKIAYTTNQLKGVSELNSFYDGDLYSDNVSQIRDCNNIIRRNRGFPVWTNVELKVCNGNPIFFHFTIIKDGVVSIFVAADVICFGVFEILAKTLNTLTIQISGIYPG